MEKDGSLVTERILNLTLEIIYLLTGQNYVAFKLSDGLVASNAMKSPSQVIESSCHSVKKNNEKVQEVTNKMIELLTGEVPIKSQDITVCMSMEEGVNLEGHKDLYNDIMSENRLPPISLDGPSDINPPEGCAGPLYSQDCLQEEHKVSQDYEHESLVKVKEEAEEIFVRCEELCKEEEVSLETNTEPADSRDPLRDVKFEEERNIRNEEAEKQTEISTGGQHSENIPDRCPIIPSYGDLENHITSNSSEGNHMIPNLHPAPASADLLCDLSTHGGSFPDHSPFISYHTGPEMFSCSGCGECFAQRAELLSHQAAHTGESYSILQREKSFPQRRTLLPYQRTHTGEKPFSCLECGKCFATRSKLAIHHRTHSGERPFSCSECGRCFSQIGHLITHQMTHTGEKPYSCSECGKRFTRRLNLKRHQRTHVELKQFSCLECGKQFLEKASFMSHLSSHWGHVR